MNGRQRFGAEQRAAGIAAMTRQEVYDHKVCDAEGCETRPRFRVTGHGYLCQKHKNSLT